jgi:hypothetical protein
VFELGLVQRWATMLARTKLGLLPEGAERDRLAEQLKTALDPVQAVRVLPLSEGPFPAGLVPWLYTWLEHPNYDEFWAEIDVAAHANEIDVPMLTVVGYYDFAAPGGVALDAALMSHPDAHVRENSRVLIGPWAHSSYFGGLHPRYVDTPTTVTGVRDWGPIADAGATAIGALLLDWFGAWLRPDREDANSAQVPRARYFVMGERVWRDAEGWPPPSTPSSWYLHSGGHANGSGGDGLLSTAAPAAAEPADSYRYDPLDPVPTIGGAILLAPEFGEDGIQDQAEVEQRTDVLVYTSAVLTDPVTIAGPVRLQLCAASSAVDTDFTAKLVDVEPDGFCANISEGIFRVRNRGGTLAEDALIEPGQAYEFTIRLFDVAHSFQPGHRIRLEVSSSNFPRFARNLNSATHPHRATAADAVVATQQVFHDTEHPTRLVLPVTTPG